jgi:hypothetical protein
MATAPVIEKPSTVKEVDLVQQPLRSDVSFLDKMRKDPTKPDTQKRHLYWYGVLPTSGPARNGKSAVENWMREDGMSLWSGKCQWFQNIAIRGIEFPAFTGTSQRSPVQSPNQPISNGITMAGTVGEFTDEEVKEHLFQADHHMIRDPHHPDRPETATIYRLIRLPEGSENWVHESQNPEFQTHVRTNFNSSTDRPVSDFVYFVKIKDRFQQHDVPALMRNPQPSLSGR